MRQTIFSRPQGNFSIRAEEVPEFIKEWSSIVLQILKKRLIYFITAATMAYAMFSLTAYVYFELSNRNVLTATIMNFIAIIVALVLEKIEE
jgi:hypothetical protein